jgi:hypothetical protein
VISDALPALPMPEFSTDALTTPEPRRGCQIPLAPRPRSTNRSWWAPACRPRCIARSRRARSIEPVQLTTGMLAEYRNRRFNHRRDAAQKPEDVLSALVDVWCRSRATRALQSVLPVLSSDSKSIPDPAKALAALQQIKDFTDNEVSPSEKGMLLLAIAALKERSNKGVGWDQYQGR